MRVGRLWLTHFRNYNHAEAELAPGLTLVVGPNGEGKTNLLEAVAFLATLSSFRGAPTEALVEVGCERAVVRAEGERGGRRLLVEAELAVSGRPRVAVNRQAVRRTRDLLDSLRVSVFAPDDLVLVKGGPAERRRWLDEALAALRPQADATRADFERILRQRNALLRQAGGRLDASASATLDVWDAKLTATGEALATARAQLLAQLEPRLDDCYHQLSGTGT